MSHSTNPPCIYPLPKVFIYPKAVWQAFPQIHNQYLPPTFVSFPLAAISHKIPSPYPLPNMFLHPRQFFFFEKSMPNPHYSIQWHVLHKNPQQMAQLPHSFHFPQPPFPTESLAHTRYPTCFSTQGSLVLQNLCSTHIIPSNGRFFTKIPNKWPSCHHPIFPHQIHPPR